MKIRKLLIVCCGIALLSMSLPAQARHSHFHRIMEHYRDQPEVSNISFPPSVFSYLLGKDDADLKHFLRQLHSLNIYTCDKGKTDLSDMKADISKSLSADAYEDLMVVNDGTDHFEIKMRKEDDQIREMVIFVTDAESLVVLHLEGNIDLKCAMRLTHQIKKNGV